MGTATAFQAGLDRAEARRQDREAHDMLQRQFLAQQYQHLADNIRLPDAKADPEGYKDALDQRAKLLDAMQKVYSPEHHATLAEHLHGLIFGPKRQPVASPVSGQAPVAPGSPAPATAADPGAAQPAPEHPFAHNPVYAEILKGLDGLGSRLKAASSPAPQQPLPSIASFASVPTDAELAANDALKRQKDAEAAKLEEIKEQNKGKLEVARLKPETSRVYTLSHLTGDDLAKRMELFPDDKILGVEGQPITPEAIASAPQGTVWTQFRQGGQDFWAPTDPTTRTVTIGNEVYQVGQYGSILSGGVPLGQAKVGTSHVTTQTAPGGGQVVSGTSTIAPVTQGMSGQKTAAPKPAAKLTRPSAAKGTVSPQSPQAGTESILPNIQNMTPRNAAMAQKAQPAVSALLGMYGDPQNPDVKSMADFAPLASDPHAQRVLGEAFKLLDQQMGEISDPGIIQTLGTSAGWANFRANAEAKAQQNVGMKMTPEEKDYFDTAIASMADIIGARSATGQSPARFSVRAIQNELPLIGTSSVTNPQQYINKMLTVARQIQVGLNAMPDNARALKWLQKRENDLLRQSNAASPKLNKKKPISSQSPQFGVTVVTPDQLKQAGVR